MSARVTASPTVALKRLVAALDARGFHVELRKRMGATGRSMVLRRDGVRRVVEFAPHTTRLNLWLLFGIATASVNVRGAGMTWGEVREVTRWAPILPWEEVARTKVSRRKGAA